MGGDTGRPDAPRPARRHHGRTAHRPGRAGRGRPGGAGGRRRGAGRCGPGRIRRAAQPGDRPRAGGGPGGELPLPRPGLRHGPTHGPPGLLPQGLALAHRPGRGHPPAGRGRVPRLRGRTRPGHRRRPAGRHHGDRRQPGPLRGRAGGHRRRQRPPDPAHQDPVLRGEVLPHVHPGRPVADPGGRRRPGGAGLAAAHPVGQRPGAAGQHRGGHDRRTGAGADAAVPVPAHGARGPAADRHARRHRPQGTREGRREAGRAAAARHPVEAVLRSGRRATPGTCATATSSPRRSPPPTGG